MNRKNYVSLSVLALLTLGLTACGGGGSSNTGSTSGNTGGGGTVADTTGPTLSFSPATASVASGQTFSISLAANDSGGIASGPSVSCTNGGSFANDVFTAPAVTVDTTIVCTATATDMAGNSSSETLTVTILAPVPDTTAPTVSFTPNALTLGAGQSGNAQLTATDSGGLASGPTVTCTNGGSFAAGVFTAPAVTVDTTSVCTATATDTAGNAGSGTLTVTVLAAPPVDTVNPVVMFSPATLTVESGLTGNSTLTATDNNAVTSGPTVSCTNGGSFAGNVFTAAAVTGPVTSICTAIAEDAAGNQGTATLTVMMTPPSMVTLSGTASYDFVPHSTQTNGGTFLNYAATELRPIRGATAQLLDASGAVLQASKTDALGGYSFTLDPNTNVRVRVLAEMVQTSGAQWDIRVQDNTSANALYAIQGTLTSSGPIDSTRDLIADSGWGGSSYTSQRQAAPFAIMDPIYDAVTDIAAIDPDVVFPPAFFNWSINNRPVSGSIANGEIGTSSYIGNGNILILGDENCDTDEYDDHVNVHEWGHYFEDQLSRSDSIGGPHGGSDRLDPRVAFGEGFGNALSGIITGDPFYRDSGGPSQGGGFAFSVETNTTIFEGWYNESSVQSILYDIFDAANDTADSLSVGIGPVYETFVSPNYINTPYFTTIFAYLDEYKRLFPADSAAIDALAADRNVNGTGPDGAGETSDGFIASSLPVYNTVNVNGAATEVCSVDNAGSFNKLGNRAYLLLNVTSPGVHTLTMTRNAATSSANNRDPDFSVFRNGTFLGRAITGVTNTETRQFNLLSTGLHVIDAYDSLNVDSTNSQGDACYNFTVTR